MGQPGAGVPSRRGPLGLMATARGVARLWEGRRDRCALISSWIVGVERASGTGSLS